MAPSPTNETRRYSENEQKPLEEREALHLLLFDLARESGLVKWGDRSCTWNLNDPALQDKVQYLAELTGVDTKSRDQMLAEIHDAVDFVRQRSSASIPTQVVIDSLFKIIKHEGAKGSTLKTYTKWYAHFERRFPEMPLELDPLLDYLTEFDGDTRRTRRNQQDRIKRLYEHGMRFCGVPTNPLRGVRRPEIKHLPIRTLTLDEATALDKTPQTATERADLDMLLGHGWRQIEARRILAGDVRRATNGEIWVWGKERNEPTPILSETLKVLSDLVPAFLTDDQPILRSRRIRNGGTEPLGENGMRQLNEHLFSRAGIEIHGHDLRRSFATLVRQASKDEYLAMRLIRDMVPELHERYINFAMADLVLALERYSPLRLIKQTGKDGENTVPGRGENGGDGGGLVSIVPKHPELVKTEAGAGSQISGMRVWIEDYTLAASLLEQFRNE